MTAAAAERARAARLLHQVVTARRTTDQVMDGASVTPLIQEMLLGSLRHYFSLSAAVDAALHRPLKPKDQELRALMIVGAYQLRFMRVPDHAAIFETVDACSELGRPWARGLVNAVLRKLAAAPAPAAGASEHPSWLEQALRDTYADAEAVMAANNQRAPMGLRINLARVAPQAYVERLAAAGHPSRAPAASISGDGLPPGPETRILEAPCPAETLPGHGEGLVAVQDAGAQYAALLVAPEAGERVLDACAAPGGKLFHLFERCPQARLTALEVSHRRRAHVEQEAARLGHRNIEVLEADAATLAWWDGVGYQRVLLDAPCSGTGTLRRHPDIKVLRRAEDVAGWVALQRRLLSNLWRVLEPGGTLVYCTCSILAAENDGVISSFLADRPDAVLEPLRLATGRATRHGWQLLPTDPDTDGFYYARMTKASG